MKNLLRMLVIVLVLAMAMTAGATVTVYDQPFDSGLTGTIWLEGQGGTNWNPYLSGGPNGTPAGSAALYHNHTGNYCPISAQSGVWAYYWTRPTVNNVFTVPGGGGASSITISYDFWRSAQGWTVIPYFAGYVQFTDSVTYPDEFFATTGTTVAGGWSPTISQTLSYTGDKVIASVLLYQLNTQVYNNLDGGVFIDNLLFAYDNLLITAEEIPEPATIVLLSLGGLLLRRKK